MDEDKLIAWTFIKKQLDQISVLIKDSQRDATPEVYNEARDLLKQINWSVDEIEKLFL